MNVLLLSEIETKKDEEPFQEQHVGCSSETTEVWSSPVFDETTSTRRQFRRPRFPRPTPPPPSLGCRVLSCLVWSGSEVPPPPCRRPEDRCLRKQEPGRGLFRSISSRLARWLSSLTPLRWTEWRLFSGLRGQEFLDVEK